MTTEEKIQEHDLKLERLTIQINRLVSDAESEKELRKERNRTKDERDRKIEIDVDRITQIIGVIKWIAAAVGLLIVNAIYQWFVHK